MSKLGSDLHKTNIWVVFCQILGTWHTQMTIYRATPNCSVINLYKYHHTLIFVDTYIIKWSKLGSFFLPNTSIWGHFLVKFGYLTPRGDHI